MIFRQGQYFRRRNQNTKIPLCAKTTFEANSTKTRRCGKYVDKYFISYLVVNGHSEL